MALRLPDNGTFVEVGVWAGHSLIYFLSCLRQLSKSANVYAVDTFQGSQFEPNHKEMIEKEFGGDLYKHFLNNLEQSGFAGKVNIIKLPSTQAAGLFNDCDIDFLFLDAGHTYQEVLDDIKYWEPKVKGIIGGHDYDCEEVSRAVNSCFAKEELLFGDDHTWFVDFTMKG